MNTLFAQEIYIRLKDDKTGFVCTVKYGKFHAKATEFPLNRQPIPDGVDEKAPMLVRKRSSGRDA